MRLKRMRALGALLTGVIMASGLAACGGSADNDQPAAVEQPKEITADRVEKAKAEGKVVVYASLPTQVWDTILPAFRKAYPGVSVETVDISGADLAQRVLSETKTGSATADLLIDGQQITWQSLTDEVAERSGPYDDALPDFAKPRPGLYAVYADPAVLLYNKLLLKGDDVPESYEDLATLPKEFENKLTTYEFGNDNFYSRFWTLQDEQGQAAWDLFTPLFKQSTFEASGGSMLQKMSQGEYVAGYFQTGVARGLLKPMKLDNVIGWTYPKDAMVLSPRYSAVTKSAKHPEAAALLQDFLQSREGQTLICTQALNVVRDDAAADCGQYSVKAASDAADGEVYFVPLSDQLLKDKPALKTKFDAARGR